MSTATQRAKTNDPELEPSIHKYRVVVGTGIIGQFSNLKLAVHTAPHHRGAKVLDTSSTPPLVVFKDGKACA